MPGHWLVIHKEAEDWEIVHEDDCRMIKLYDENPLNPGSGPVMEYDCLVGRIVASDGIDDHLTYASGGGWRNLEPGRYEIKAWEWMPAGGYSDEYEAGIEFVDKDDRE
jgi:hypothetical protein